MGQWHMADAPSQAAVSHLGSISTSPANADKPATRSHLYEIDLVRSVTALSVIGVHVVAITVFLTHSVTGELIQNAVVSALHFTREIFVAITSFVMVYGYAKRPFSSKSFWRKRAIGVLLPYVVWSVFYELVQGSHLSPVPWTQHLLADLVTGSASFQLYYILLTLEFYLIFPWFLGWIQRAAKRPWLLLGSSFALQLVLMYLDYRIIQTGPFNGTPLGKYLNLNQARFLPLYQFYVVLGGVAALYINQVRAALLRYGSWTIAALVVTLALLVGNMVYQYEIAHQSFDYATSVFQPILTIYVLALTACLYWIAYRWAISRAPRRPSGASFWQLISNASFGIYLAQGYFITIALTDVVPNLPVGWYEPMRVALTWLFVASTTVLLCVVMLYTPGLSRLIGHPCMLPLGQKRSERAGEDMRAWSSWMESLRRAASPASLRLVLPRKIFPLDVSWRQISHGRSTTTNERKEDLKLPHSAWSGQTPDAADVASDSHVEIP